MSDIHQDDKPWNLVDDRRPHRCVPVRKRRGRLRLGERADCSCGVEYVWMDSRIGGPQWLPITP